MISCQKKDAKEFLKKNMKMIDALARSIAYELAKNKKQYNIWLHFT